MNIFEFIASLFSSRSVRAAKASLRQLDRDNAKISEAERLLADLRTQKVTDARANASALADALAAAATEAEKAEIRRQAAIEAQNDKTDKVIAALEEAIQAAKDANSAKLAKLAIKHSKQRAGETSDRNTAEDALAIVRAAAGESAE